MNKNNLIVILIAAVICLSLLLYQKELNCRDKMNAYKLDQFYIISRLLVESHNSTHLEKLLEDGFVDPNTGRKITTGFEKGSLIKVGPVEGNSR